MFQKQKTIEATSFLLRTLDAEQEGMPYIKLIKLLYLADREMLKTKRRTITGDDHWALPYGPVLETTLDMIKKGEEDWQGHFETDLDAKVITEVQSAEPSALSRADLKVLKEVAETFGHLPWQKLVELTHEFPEWQSKNVTKRAKRIYLWDIAKALGFSDEEAREIVEYNAELNDIRMFQDQVKNIGAIA